MATARLMGTMVVVRVVMLEVAAAVVAAMVGSRRSCGLETTLYLGMGGVVIAF
jgi:hypothetical protein